MPPAQSLTITDRTALPTAPSPAVISVEPAERIRLPSMRVPGDLSSAAFHLVAGLIVKGSRVSVEGVGLNPTRVGLLGILNRMGASIEVEETGFEAGEPVGRISARAGALAGTRVGGAEVPLAIDELPLVALLGCFAEGETIVTGAEELRHKESDRVETVVGGLSALGARIEALPDGFVVTGTGGLRGRLDRCRGRSPDRDARRRRRACLAHRRRGPGSRGGVRELPRLRGGPRVAHGGAALSAAAIADPGTLAASTLTAAMVIAIDGPAGAGKSTVAKALAERLGFTYLDSGAMYRCVALSALRAGAAFDDPAQVEPLARELELRMSPGRVELAGEDVSAAIREPEVTAAASRVSVHPGVRQAMVDRQRELVADGGWVAEGRDIGTVVCPESPLKVFLTASEQERAERRALQSGRDAAAILAEQRDRDARDRERQHGALKPAADSVEVETTGLDIAEVVERIADLATERSLT